MGYGWKTFRDKLFFFFLHICKFSVRFSGKFLIMTSTINNSQSILIENYYLHLFNYFWSHKSQIVLCPHTKLFCCCCTRTFIPWAKNGALMVQVTTQTPVAIPLMILGFRQSNSGMASLFEVILIWAYPPQDRHSRECFKSLKVTRFEALPKLYTCSKRPKGTFASVIASSGSSSTHKGLLQTSGYAQWVQGVSHSPLGMF